MDLHLTAEKASLEEQAAIDAALKKQESEGDGASPAVATDGHAASNGLPPRSKRHLLLPVLHAIQERMGWITPGALNYASLQLGLPPAVFLDDREFTIGSLSRVSSHTCATTLRA